MGDDPIEHSRETRHLLNNHIQLTQIKLDNIDERGERRHEAVVGEVAQLKKTVQWAGGLIVSLVLTLLAWSLAQQYSANESAKNDMQQQLNLLKTQELERVRAREEILSRLPPGAAQTAGAARSLP